ncbi:MAG: transposase [Melioribacteraceae bacterium]
MQIPFFIYHYISISSKHYDYSQPGAYFITICTHNRECLFGKINDGKMFLNDIGEIAKQCWFEIPNHFPNVSLDEFVIMPNHIHGIIILNDNMVDNGNNQNVDIPNVGVQNFEPLRKKMQQNQFQKIIPRSIGSIIRGFKIGVTKWCRQNTNIYTVWQRNYFEHIIRNDIALQRIRQYIVDNPMKWELDMENTHATEHQINQHYQTLMEA